MKRTTDYLNEIAQKTDIFYELSEEENKALKECLLEMYLDITQVCEKHNLCIMLGGGSVLGAIRHQGFIPWDDDLDLNMPREDYNKFRDLFKEELGHKYFITAPCTDEDSEILFMQIIKRGTRQLSLNNVHVDEKNGIRIDIFPIENTSSNKFKRTILAIVSDTIQRILYSISFYKIQIKNPIYRDCYKYNTQLKIIFYIRATIGMLFSIFPQKKMVDKFDTFISNIKGDKYCTVPTGRKHYKGETRLKSVFFPVRKTLFEGIEVNIPNDADSYLKDMYGDYMQIPSVEKRERHFYVEFNLNTNKI